MTKASDNEFPSVLFGELASAPATPAAGKWRLYTKAGGLYYIDDAGAEIGPLAAAGSAPAFSGCVLTKSATQAITTATETAVSFDGEVFDTDNYHDNTTNNTRLTAPATGYYMVGGSVELDGLADAKNAIVRIRKQGTNANGDGRARGHTAFTDPLSLAFSRIVYLESGQYVELTVEHNRGSNSNVRESTNGTSFWIHKIM